MEPWNPHPDCGISPSIDPRTFIPAFLEWQAFLARGDHERACRPLQRLLQLEPDNAGCHVLIAGSLVEAGRLEEAGEAFARARRDCRSADLPLLAPVARRLLEARLTRELEPARAAFRRGEHARALALLDEIEVPLRGARLYRVFRAYLRRLAGGPLASVLHFRRERDFSTPPAPAGDVEVLCAFLAGDEAVQAREHIAAGQYDEADRLLRDVMLRAPGLWPLHSLLAECLYARAVSRAKHGHPPEPLIGDLDRALEAARTVAAAHGPTGAPELLRRLGEGRAALLAARDRREREAREARLVNGAILEFTAIMETSRRVRCGREFRQVRRRITALRRRLPTIRRQVRTPEVVAAVERLSGAVSRNCRAIGE